MKLKILHDYCNQLLSAEAFDDYCPNGLQVEVHDEVNHLATAVTASLEAIEAAAAIGADTLLVHHGYFWKNESAVLTGAKGRRIKALFAHGINLLAYHLPLDAHEQLGNNRQLAQQLGWSDARLMPGESLLWGAELPQAQSVQELVAHIGNTLEREPLHIAAGATSISRIAWCTGAAQEYIDKAIAQNFDAYLSGEISESTVHQAREAGIHYIAAGHHATERYGVKALGQALEEKFALPHQFIDIDNPV